MKSRGIALTIIALVGGGIVLVAVALLVAARLAQRPAGVGNPSEPLESCPAKPNCVSSLGEDARHAMPPIRYRGDLASARARLIAIIRATDRATIITQTEDYIHAEFRSALFGFVDDVEFRFRDAPKVIDFRSASRFGSSDLGVNRRRMERIQEAFRSSER